jgi:polyhydroxybutyrate depolymerase
MVDGGSPSVDARSCAPSTIKAGTFHLVFQNVEYGYVVHLPPDFKGTKATPLVLNWHGYTASASLQETFSGMDAVADAAGFVLVYPDSPDGSWNAGTCCAFKAPNRDDVGFARALVQKIQSETCIDPKRIYTTGMSNGAFMSYRLGCEAADLFAAIAPVDGKVGVPNCKPSRPVPLLAFHGTADSLLPYSTGSLSADNLDVPHTVQKWAAQDLCREANWPAGVFIADAGTEHGPTVTYRVGTVTCQTYWGCSAGATVTLCSAAGEEHCWPGMPSCPFGAYTMDIDASRAIAAFFGNFSLP